jgi:signal transduction histidine kinase/ligand-binding sensor domain-containing protein
MVPRLVETKQNAGMVRAAVLLGIFGFISTSQSAGLNPNSLISQYGHTVWRVQDGAFGGNPTAFAQTPDGYIWVGTQGGLYRFDGINFVALNPPGQQYPLTSASIQSLYPAKDGSLWIGTRSRLAHWANGKLTNISAPLATVGAIAQDNDGAIWIIRSGMQNFSGPICKISADTERCYGKPDGIQSITASSMVSDAQGRFWIGGGGTLIEWQGKLVGEYPLPGGKGYDDGRPVAGVAVNGNSGIWVGVGRSGPGNGLQLFANGQWRTYIAPGLNGTSLVVQTLLLDRDNCLWVGTADHGIYRIRGGTVDNFEQKDGLSGNSVYQIFQDREGGIWVATGEGVDHFRELPILTYSNSEGLKDAASIESVLARRDGSIAVGADSALFSIRGAAITQQKMQPGLPSNGTGCLLEDHLGNLWLGTLDGGLVAEVDGKLRTVLKGDPEANVASLAEDTDHVIWAVVAGAHPRLIRIDNFQVREIFEPQQVPGAYSVIADPLGGVWVSLFDGCLMHYQKGKWEKVSMDPLTRKYGVVGASYNLSFDSNGTLWGAAAGGVVGYKDRNLQLLNERNGLPCRATLSTISDLHNDLWIQAPCGLVRIEHSELERWWANPESKLKISTFTALQGFRAGYPGGRPAVTRDTEGKLWFQNQNAVMAVDPENLAANPIVPPVHVENVIADRNAYPIQSDFRLPARTRQLELDYTGLSYVVPSKVLFRYRLDGYDHQWQEPGTRRAAFYNDLPPGSYTFHVIACNDSGLWNTEGASLQFRILPAYYQTAWFKALCVVAFMALLWALFQLRLHQIQQRFVAGLEASVGERIRIARELHDTLLQGFQGLMGQIQAAINMLPRKPEKAKEALEEAVFATEQAIAEGRDAIRDLRPEPVAQRDLPELLNAAGKELAIVQESIGHSPSFRVTVEGEIRTLSVMLQDEVYRIAREVIRNAFRHAAASRIEVEVHYDEDQLRLRIRDDGKGIDPEVVAAGGRQGHWGISGMRERAKRIGAQLDFWCEDGAGTEVQLKVPGTTAYEKRQNGHRFRLFGRKAGDERRSYL